MSKDTKKTITAAELEKLTAELEALKAENATLVALKEENEALKTENATLKEKAARKPRGTSEKTLEKRKAQNLIRGLAENLVTEYALENGLTVKENENVPDVFKLYRAADDAFVLYARFGLKSIQWLMKDGHAPEGLEVGTMKYSLPVSYVQDYKDTENCAVLDKIDGDERTAVLSDITKAIIAAAVAE